MKPTSLRALSQQLAGNLRLQVGVGLIAALLFAFVLQALHDWRVGQQKQAIAKEIELRQTRSLRGQDIWLQRAEQVSIARKALLAEIPIVDTPGLAQASLQSWLRNVGNTMPTASGLEIDVAAPVEMEEHPGIYRARAVVRAGLTPRQAFDFMATVESAPNLAVVETAQVRADKAGRVTMNIVGYYRTRGDGEPAP